MATSKKTPVKKSAAPAKPAATKVAKKAAKKVVKKVVKKAAPAKAKEEVKKPAKAAAKKTVKKVVAKPAAKKALTKKAAPKATKPVAPKAAPKVAAKAAPKKAAPKKSAAPKAAPKLPADPVRDLAIDLARLASDLRCSDVVVQDVTGHSPLTRFMVLATGISNRQLKAVAQSMEELGKERDFPPYQIDADANTTWVVLDLVHIMIHLFEPESRSHYDLETQFPDAKAVKWQR